MLELSTILCPQVVSWTTVKESILTILEDVRYLKQMTIGFLCASWTIVALWCFSSFVKVSTSCKLEEMGTIELRIALPHRFPKFFGLFRTHFRGRWSFGVLSPRSANLWLRVRYCHSGRKHYFGLWCLVKTKYFYYS